MCILLSHLMETTMTRTWLITGTRRGKIVSVLVEAKNMNEAIMMGSKGRHCLVVSQCVLYEGR